MLIFEVLAVIMMAAFMIASIGAMCVKYGIISDTIERRTERHQINPPKVKLPMGPLPGRSWLNR